MYNQSWFIFRCIINALLFEKLSIFDTVKWGENINFIYVWIYNKRKNSCEQNRFCETMSDVANNFKSLARILIYLNFNLMNNKNNIHTHSQICDVCVCMFVCVRTYVLRLVYADDNIPHLQRLLHSFPQLLPLFKTQQQYSCTHII